jgi:predicted permease
VSHEHENPSISDSPPAQPPPGYFSCNGSGPHPAKGSGGQIMIDHLRQLFQRFASLFRRAQLDRDLESEMASHLALAIEENLQHGMSPAEARRQALVHFGGTQQAKENHRDSRGIPALEVLLQDLRYTFRALRKDRAFTAVAVLILALGIGANIVVFSVVNTILLRPLPLAHSQQLVWLAGNNGLGGLSDVTYRVDVFEEFQRSNHSFQQVTAFVPYYSLSETKLMTRGEPRPVSFVWVDGTLFQTLGVQPALGRSFTHEECVKGGKPAVLLSYFFWQRQFAGDPKIVGQAIQLDKLSATVVGVLPASFDFGAVFAPGSKLDFFRPVAMDDIRTWGHMLSLVGRLKPGVSVPQAQAEANILLPQLPGANDDNWSTDLKTTISGLQDHVTGKLRRSLLVLWGAVALILLIVCVNLSNLLLARLASRHKEFALRGALGASRGRLIRQLLTESLVLSAFGAFLGVALALAVTLFLAHQSSFALPLLSTIRVDAAALAWTLLLTLIVGVLFGLAPGFALSSGNLQKTLKDATRGSSEGREHGRMRSVLVVSEVALACVLLVSAGLFLRSFLRILDVDLGFQPAHAAAIKVDYDDGGNGTRRSAILQDMLQRVSAIPGVQAAGVSDMLPLDRNRSWDLLAKGKVYSKDVNDDAFVYVVTPGYLAAMGMHLIEGRDFTWQDSDASEPVIIINQSAARREWPNEDPIGRLAQGIGDKDSRVVGVIADVHESSLEDASSPAVLVPVTQHIPEGAELVVRTQLPPETLASAVMSTLRVLNPEQPATEFRPIQQLVDHSVSPRRFFVLLVAIFAALGLVLAALGIYGVISYSVTRQTQEIGIRMALGATPARIRFGVLAKTLRLAIFGIAIGAMASFAASKLIASLLFKTEPTDPATFLGVLLLLLAVAILAGYFPARRATRIDPTTALRCE